MIRLARAAAALAALLAVSSPSIAAPTKAPTHAAATPVQAWPQVHSDLPADPTIRFGTLPNGMRYALRKQSIPPGQAAIRLWVGAGSSMETDAQQGLAHFLEHMAFNGSKAVPEGDMIKILQRLGLAFGADTNAQTEFSQTIYKLDLPHTDAETVDTSLMLMREAASNLTISPAAVDRERGVVLSEERASDTPGYRVLIQRLNFLMPGQRLPTRLPIGKVDVLKNAPAQQIADYYRRWYRPERAVLVAVGDFDLDAMEAKIRARFGDWSDAAPSAPVPPQGPVEPRKTEAKVVVEPGASQNLMIAWTDAPDLAPDTAAHRRQELYENLGLAVLNRRYSRITREPNAPFLGAGASEIDQERAVRIAAIGVNAEVGRWKEALTAAEAEQRRIVQYGVRQDELDREIEEIRTSLKSAVAGRATRTPGQLAGEILASLNERSVVTAPDEDLRLFEAAVKGLKAETVNTALREVFHGQGPLVFLATPRPVEGGDATVLAAFEGARQVAVAPPAAVKEVAWPYASFGTPGKVAETKSISDLGVSFIRFENGVRLTVKPTKFRNDEVLVRVNVGDGMLDLPSDRQSPYWASSAYIEGGLKQIDVEDMERVLAAKLYGARFRIGEDAFELSGSTRPSDLVTQMQVLAAYATEPAWRENAFQRIKGAGKTIHDQYDSTDQGVMARSLQGLIRSGDKRWTFPSREEIADAKLDDISGPITANMAKGPIEIVIVGDVTVEAARDAVARTFGALPPRPDTPSIDTAKRKLAYPTGSTDPLVLTHKGRADQSIGYVGWPTTDYWENPTRAQATAVLGEVMKLRVLEQLREAEGATYSPDVSYTHSRTWTGWGYLSASVEVPPAKLPGFFSDVSQIASDLAAKEVSKDELERAKQPRIQQYEKAQLTNGYWLGELDGAQWDPRKLEMIRNYVAGTKKVTAADVRAAAQAWLKPDRAYKIEVLPASIAPVQAATSASP